MQLLAVATAVIRRRGGQRHSPDSEFTFRTHIRVLSLGNATYGFGTNHLARLSNGTKIWCVIVECALCAAVKELKH
jgi:hypothetical protein